MREHVAAAQAFRCEAVETEADLGGLRPDALLHRAGRRLAVEFAVTHFCRPEKMAELRRRGLPCVEVDLSAVPRLAARDAHARAILHEAPRRWLFNPRVARAEARLRAAGQARAEAERARHAPHVEAMVAAWAAPHRPGDPAWARWGVKDTRTGLWATREEVGCYPCQARHGAKLLGVAIRAHRGIENRAHHVRDVAPGEDASRIRTRPGMMARIPDHEARSGKQPGGPGRAAEAITTAVQSPEPPPRLVLGKPALESARKQLAALKQDLDAREAATLGGGDPEGGASSWILGGKRCAAGQLALAWVLAQGDDVIPIPGTREVRYPEENVAASGIVPTDEELAALDNALPAGAASGERCAPDAMRALNG